MKLNNLLLILISAVIFSSCADKNENTATEVMTHLNIDIPILTLDLNVSKSTIQNEFSFSGSKDYKFVNIVEAHSEVSNIYKVRPIEGAVLLIPEIGLNDEINSLILTISIKSITNLNTDKIKSIDLLSLNHSLNNGVLQFNLDGTIDELLSDINSALSSLQFNISGKSEFVLDCIASIQIPVIVESSTFSPRFELF